MSEIKKEIPTQEKLDQLQVKDWSHWECQPSTFDWEYSCNETAYIVEGKVKVKTANGEVEIQKGDLVHFPKGLQCTWNVTEKIRKVYTFE